MKKLLLLSIVIIGIVANAQEIYLKEATFYNPAGDSVDGFKLYYDDLWNIDSATRTLGSADKMHQYYFENDTMTHVVTSFIPRTLYYYYFDDSINMFMEQNDYYYLFDTYFIDEESRIILINNYDINGQLLLTTEYTWLFGNCIASQNNLNDSSIYEYYDEIINPYYNMYKHFRYKARGSFNYQLESLYNNSNYYFWDVISTYNNYPVEVKYYQGDDLYQTIYYEYYTVTNTQELIPNPDKVLSIKYFNILGQEISKPARGFYIEVKLTDKDVISKKYFVQ